jgi:hypothetical protein
MSGMKFPSNPKGVNLFFYIAFPIHNVMHSSVRSEHPEFIQQEVLINITVQEYLKLQGMWKRGTILVCMLTQKPHTRTINSVALVRERTITTERPPPVGEVSANFCG